MRNEIVHTIADRRVPTGRRTAVPCRIRRHRARRPGSGARTRIRRAALRIRVRLRWRRIRCRPAAREAGMTTAEYAVGTVAAVAFAAVLYKIVTSGAVASALTAVVKKALRADF